MAQFLVAALWGLMRKREAFDRASDMEHLLQLWESLLVLFEGTQAGAFQTISLFIWMVNLYLS